MNRRFQSLRCAALAGLACFGVQAQSIAPTSTPLRAYSRGFREPVRLATDSAGRLYVADPARNLITTRDEAGKLLSVKRGFSTPLGLAVDPSGRIFVCEAGLGRVSIFTSAWVPAGALGQGDGEFRMPNHLHITPEGLVYVVDSRANLVKVYGPDGALVRQFGGYGAQAGEFDFPTGITVTPRGEVFVSDQGNERVQAFDANGNFLRAFGKKNMIGTDATFGRVQGLLSDADGRIYLADAFRGVITVINSQGTTLGTLGAFGAGPGELQGPASLALDRNNRLFVAAPGNNRVEVYGLDTFRDFSLLDANLVVEPSTLDRASAAPSGPRLQKTLVSVVIRIPGVNPSAIQVASVTANGLPATRMAAVAPGQTRRESLSEFKAWFDQNRLLGTLPDGEGLLVVSGRLTDGRAFESIADVKVLPLAGGVQ